MPGSSRRPTADSAAVVIPKAPVVAWGLRSEGLLPYKIDSDPLKTPLTSFAGLPLVAETFRALGLDREADRLLTLKKRQRGYTEDQMVESFALLLAAGGECLDDFGKLRDEQGLPALLGYLPPSPDCGRLGVATRSHPRHSRSELEAPG